MREATIDEVMTWKEKTGWMGRQVFGRHGAVVSSETYAELKRRCDEVRVINSYSIFSPVRLNSFDVIVQDDVPFGILRPRVLSGTRLPAPASRPK